MKRYGCIALDLDGTLLRDGGILSKRSEETLKRAIEEGVHVVVASGRAFSTLPESVTSLPGIEYAITSNGAAIYRCSDKTCINAYKMRQESVRQILRIAERELGEPLYEVFVDGVAYAPEDYVLHPERYGLTGGGIHYVRTTRKPVKDIMGFIEKNIEALDSLDLVFRDPEEKDRIWNILQAECDNVYLTASVPRLLEISDIESGKANALAYLLKELEMEREHCIAFGNADNDADMLSFAGKGIAVENATEGCKRAADEICGSNNEDGVSRAIEKLLFG